MSVTFRPVGALLGYTIGVADDDVVALRLEYGATQEQMRAGAGGSVDVVMTPSAALELGQALVERATLALKPPGTTLS